MLRAPAARCCAAGGCSRVQKAATGECLQLNCAGTPEAPALPGVVEAEEIHLLLGWKTNHGIQLLLDYCWRMMLGRSLTYVLRSAVLPENSRGWSNLLEMCGSKECTVWIGARLAFLALEHILN